MAKKGELERKISKLDARMAGRGGDARTDGYGARGRGFRGV